MRAVALFGEETVQLVVHGVRRPVRLEELQKSLGNAGQHGPQRGEGISGPHAAELFVREPHVLTRAGRSAAGRRWFCVGSMEGLFGRSRLQMMDELSRFIMVDSREAVKVGDLEKVSVVFSIVEPNFSHCPEPREEWKRRQQGTTTGGRGVARTLPSHL